MTSRNRLPWRTGVIGGAMILGLATVCLLALMKVI